jgi:polyisoprenoid-binding protein YceI
MVIWPAAVIQLSFDCHSVVTEQISLFKCFYTPNITEMKRTFLFFILVNLFFTFAEAQSMLTADTAKTELVWLAEKVTGQHTGTVKLKSGWLNWQNNKITSGEFIIDMTSLNESENNERFEGHMRSDDFFSIDKFPTAILAINASGSFDKGNGEVFGSLTIKDITNPISFKAVMQKKDDGTWFFANIIIDRTKYDIKYGSGSFFDDLGDKTIFDEFKLRINLLVK